MLHSRRRGDFFQKRTLNQLANDGHSSAPNCNQIAKEGALAQDDEAEQRNKAVHRRVATGEEAQMDCRWKDPPANPPGAVLIAPPRLQ
jgi:hypothetical protein